MSAASTPELFLHEPGLCAVVVGKASTSSILAQQPLFASVAAQLPLIARSVRLIADLSDDYHAMSLMLNEPFLARYQEALTSHCELVAPCQALADALRRKTSKAVQVVEDPYESPHARAPRGPSRNKIDLCWFGNISSKGVGLLEAALTSIIERFPALPIGIELVGAEGRRAEFEAMLARLSALRAQVAVRFSAWSLEATWTALDRCDIVLIPRTFEPELAALKSHNRLVEALHAGRFAVAAPVPAYKELRDCAWIGEDLADGVQWAIEHHEEVLERIARGQAVVESRFSPSAVAARWAEVIRLPAQRFADSSMPAATAPDLKPSRLNLGCGDKPIPGYINVDIAPSRGGMSPDVICDLRSLKPFASSSCDEVMAIHVVEHFWRWEIEALLAEWVRVLRPGGKLILECPNLISACEALLRDPKAGTGPGPESQRTMWTLYGDPRWKDPLMTHRWAYTPESLAELLRSVGLVNVRQEPAQFKLREPRDMRVVGEKP